MTFQEGFLSSFSMITVYAVIKFWEVVISCQSQMFYRSDKVLENHSSFKNSNANVIPSHNPTNHAHRLWCYFFRMHFAHCFHKLIGPHYWAVFTILLHFAKRTWGKSSLNKMFPACHRGHWSCVLVFEKCLLSAIHGKIWVHTEVSSVSNDVYLILWPHTETFCTLRQLLSLNINGTSQHTKLTRSWSSPTV